MRMMSSSKSTLWPSNSGPSTQRNLGAPPTVTRQAPHIPIPSTMMGNRLTRVGTPWGRVISQSSFCRLVGPMAKARSNLWFSSVSSTTPTPDAEHPPVVLDLSSVTQGAGEVEEILTLLQLPQLRGALPHLCDVYGDRARLGVSARDGDGHPLARLTGPDYDELARPSLVGHGRGVHLEHLDVGRDRSEERR